MNRSINKAILVGNIGRDAETRFTQSGIAVSSFSLATTYSVKSGDEWKEEVSWHTVVLWRQENLAQHLLKGKQVYVEGRIQTRSYDDKEGVKKYTTEIVADNIILLGGNNQSQGGREETQSQAPNQQSRGAAAGRAADPRSTSIKRPAPVQDITDDDIPF